MKNEKSVSAEYFRKWAQKNHPDYEERMAEAELEINLEMKIREMRKAQKLTQADLAKKMNTQQANISRLEKDITNIKLDTLMKLAAVFGKRLNITFQDIIVSE